MKRAKLNLIAKAFRDKLNQKEIEELALNARDLEREIIRLEWENSELKENNLRLKYENEFLLRQIDIKINEQ